MSLRDLFLMFSAFDGVKVGNDAPCMKVSPYREYVPPPPRPVETVPVRTTPKIGRNAQCPCGSGKKSKRCCGKNEREK